MIECPRCKAVGEVLAASYAVGGGCVNDEWDICPACGGNGVIEQRPSRTWSTTPETITDEELEALR